MFLNPWAIIVGVLAAGLPIAVHFLTRPRPRRWPLSTLRFVREALRQRRARHRLRDVVVLALRTLAVLLLAAAIARPLVGRNQSAIEVDEDVDTVRIVILDVSQSMAARAGGAETFERARPVAADLLAYRPALKANLILAGARPAALFSQPSTNFAALREELATAQPQPQQADVQAALNLASEMLAGSVRAADGRAEVVIVSDFQRTNWSTADFSVFPSGAAIRLESVAPESAPPNIALLRAASAGPVEAGRESRLEVEVGNFSPTPQQVRVEVRLGEAAWQLSGICLPRTTTTLATEVLAGEPGWQTGEARLVGLEDALPADNVRPCAMQVRPPPVYALITRQPEGQRPSSSYYLERALVPGEDEDRGTRGGTRIVRLDPDDPDRELLGLADLLVVDHPGAIPDETIQQLAALLQRGRGLLYVAAEAEDAINLRRLADTLRGGWQLPVEFAPLPAGQDRNGLFVTDVQREQPPFRVFGDELTAALGPLRFGGGLATRPVDGALAEDVLASFNDRSAFLVADSSGAGSMIVMNADLGASSLPRSPMFVPLVGEIARRLRGRTADVDEFASGGPLAVYLPASAGAADGLRIIGPDGASSAMGTLSAEAAGVLWKSDAAGHPGVYRVERGGETQFALITTVPAGESDLRTLSADVFETRLAGGRDVRFRAQATLKRDEQDLFWTWLALGCVVCLLGEVATLRMFRT